MEGNRRLVQPHAQRCQHTFEHCSLPWWQGWQIIHRVPLSVSLHRFARLLIHEREKGNGQFGTGRMTPPIAERSRLLHQRWCGAERFLRELCSLTVDGLIRAKRSPWE